VLEASTRIECEGVCVATYRPSELNGYRILRYRGIGAPAVAINAGGENVAAPSPTPAAMPVTAPAPTPPAAAPAPANAGQNNAAPPAATAAVADQEDKSKRVKKRRVRR